MQARCDLKCAFVNQEFFRFRGVSSPPGKEAGHYLRSYNRNLAPPQRRRLIGQKQIDTTDQFYFRINSQQSREK